MKFNVQGMQDTLNKMLRPGEIILCPVYAIINNNGFFRGFTLPQPGFITFTSDERFLVARWVILDDLYDYCEAADFQKLRIGKQVMGQEVVEAVFECEGKKINISIHIPHTLIGNKFPDQQKNCGIMISSLKPYQIL